MSLNSSDACCENTSTQEMMNSINPVARPGKSRFGAAAPFTLRNPLPDEVADSQELKKFFTKWNLVPYAGSTDESGHMLLIYYVALTKLCPTHGTAISKLNSYAFGSRAAFMWSEDPEYDTGEQFDPVQPKDATKFMNILKKYVEFKGGIREFHKWIGWSLKAVGNAWVEMVVASTGNESRVSLKYHKPLRCLYLNTKPGEAKMVGISPIWSDEYLTRKGGPRVVPMYPLFTRNEDGTLSTMFHLKEGQNDWYGRPDTEMVDYAKTTEAEHFIYLFKQAKSNFTGQLIIEVEDDDPNEQSAIDDKASQEKGYRDYADEFEQTFTNKSEDPMAVMVAARPYKSNPMFVFQLKPNTNEKWYTTIGKELRGVILRAHRCTLRWFGEEVGNGFSTDAFVDDYIFNQMPTEADHRRNVTVFTNSIITAVWETLGLTNVDGIELNKMSITFYSPIKAQVDEYQTSRKNANNNNAVGGENVQSGRTKLPGNAPSGQDPVS